MKDRSMPNFEQRKAAQKTFVQKLGRKMFLKLTLAVVNFINILRRRFLLESSFKAKT